MGEETKKRTVFGGWDVANIVVWDNLTEGSPGESLLCDGLLPCAAQVEGGPFGRVILEGNCGGETWEPIVSFSTPFMKNVDTGAVRVRPRVEGGTATLFLVVRR